jgi:hypothetical protein
MRNPVRERSETERDQPERERLTWCRAAIIVIGAAIMIGAFAWVVVHLLPPPP